MPVPYEEWGRRAHELWLTSVAHEETLHVWGRRGRLPPTNNKSHNVLNHTTCVDFLRLISKLFLIVL